MPDTTGSDDLFSSALSRSSPLLDSSRIPPSSDNHSSPCPPTLSRSLSRSPGPVLRPARNSLGSIRWATSTALLSDNNHEERDGSSSYASNPHDRPSRRRSDIVTGSMDSADAVEGNRRFKLRSRAAHVDANLDGSRPSFVTSFFRRTVRRVKRPSGESDAGSDTARNGGQKRDDVNVKRKGTQLARPQARPVTSGLIEERLEVTNKLHEDAVDLQMFYESKTVATMRDLRVTGKAVPCGLQKQNAETFYFQYSRGHFQRTMPYSTKRTFCWQRFDGFTRN
jgi:hypothetical protein